MLERKAFAQMEAWKRHKGAQALLVDGARQVGKTFAVREFARRNYGNLVEINLYDRPDAAEALSRARGADDLMARITAFAKGPLVPRDTLVFLDEVQMLPEVATAVKFLVERNDYDFVLSGSLLGVELRNIESVPVGYLDSIRMFPLDFEEFCWAVGVAPQLVDEARAAAAERRPVPDYLHARLLDAFHRYLIVGGMPAAADAYETRNDLQAVLQRQLGVVARLREDVSRYGGDRALYIKEVFDLIPSELNSKSKRFKASALGENARMARRENEFLWLADAGVALPTYAVDEPRYPLLLSKKHRAFKLFLCDVGLLTALCMPGAVTRILREDVSVNHGSVYENAIAQELAAHDFSLYYFNSKRRGEVDFLAEHLDGTVVPIEVKSGKDYKRHAALSNILATPEYGIGQAVVLCEGNVEQRGRVLYLPVYMAMFLEPSSPL